MIDFSSIITNKGTDLLSLSKERPVLLVFLRHFGCVFCRDSLKELSSKRAYFEAEEVEIVFVHMTEYDIADMYFDKFGLKGSQHVSDPGCNYYEQFGLVKGNFNQLFGLQNMIRGFDVTMRGTFISLKQIGDGFQMPGVFMVKNGQIVDSFIHKYASDKPDYERIVKSLA